MTYKASIITALSSWAIPLAVYLLFTYRVFVFHSDMGGVGAAICVFAALLGTAVAFSLWWFVHIGPSQKQRGISRSKSLFSLLLAWLPITLLLLAMLAGATLAAIQGRSFI